MTDTLGTVLVAGAGGALGSAIVEKLMARGYRARALVRRPVVGGAAAVEWVQGDALHPETLVEAFRGVDAVISSLGASVQPNLRGWRGYWGVDWPANRNLIEAAERAGVRRFVYVSVVHNEKMKRLAYVAAHEAVAERLQKSSLGWSVLRPTGFFSAYRFFLDMAQGGTVWQLGSGAARSNPIHPADLGEQCVAALDGPNQAVDVGGPEVLSRQEMAQLAFDTLGKPVRIRHSPLFGVRFAGFMMRPFHPRLAGLLSFAAAVSRYDLIAPQTGSHRLQDYFAELTKTG